MLHSRLSLNVVPRGKARRDNSYVAPPSWLHLSGGGIEPGNLGQLAGAVQHIADIVNQNATLAFMARIILPKMSVSVKVPALGARCRVVVSREKILAPF